MYITVYLFACPIIITSYVLFPNNTSEGEPASTKLSMGETRQYREAPLKTYNQEIHSNKRLAKSLIDNLPIDRRNQLKDFKDLIPNQPKRLDDINLNELFSNFLKEHNHMHILNHLKSGTHPGQLKTDPMKLMKNVFKVLDIVIKPNPSQHSHEENYIENVLNQSKNSESAINGKTNKKNGELYHVKAIPKIHELFKNYSSAEDSFFQPKSYEKGLLMRKTNQVELLVKNDKDASNLINAAMHKDLYSVLQNMHSDSLKFDADVYTEFIDVPEKDSSVPQKDEIESSEYELSPNSEPTTPENQPKSGLDVSDTLKNSDENGESSNSEDNNTELKTDSNIAVGKDQNDLGPALFENHGKTSDFSAVTEIIIFATESEGSRFETQGNTFVEPTKQFKPPSHPQPDKPVSPEEMKSTLFSTPPKYEPLDQTSKTHQEPISHNHIGPTLLENRGKASNFSAVTEIISFATESDGSRFEIQAMQGNTFVEPTKQFKPPPSHPQPDIPVSSKEMKSTLFNTPPKYEPLDHTSKNFKEPIDHNLIGPTFLENQGKDLNFSAVTEIISFATEPDGSRFEIQAMQGNTFVEHTKQSKHPLRNFLDKPEQMKSTSFNSPPKYEPIDQMSKNLKTLIDQTSKKLKEPIDQTSKNHEPIDQMSNANSEKTNTNLFNYNLKNPPVIHKDEPEGPETNPQRLEMRYRPPHRTKKPKVHL